MWSVTARKCMTCKAGTTKPQGATGANARLDDSEVKGVAAAVPVVAESEGPDDR